MHILRALSRNSIISFAHCNNLQVYPKALFLKKYLILCYKFPKKYSGFNSSSFENEFDEGLELRYKIDHQAITRGSNENWNKLKKLLLDLEMKLASGTKLPENLNTEHWRKLITYSETEQEAFLRHRLIVESLNEMRAKEKLQNNTYFNDEICSKGLFCESVTEHIPRFYNFKLLKSMLYGPNIVIDCGFQDFVTKDAIWEIAYHMFQTWHKNRMSPNPSHIIFCNVDYEGELFSSFMELFSEVKSDPTFPLSCTEKSYLDLFPREDLVYLSPDSRFTMERYNGNKIYVIGGMSPRVGKPLTFEKAVDEDLLTNKFPLEKHMDWSVGPKILTITECIGVLNDLQDGYDWSVAFRHVSKGKWAKHALDERRNQLFRKNKRPSEMIQKKYRKDFLRNNTETERRTDKFQND